MNVLIARAPTLPRVSAHARTSTSPGVLERAFALVVLFLELYLAWAYRSAFRPMLHARVTPG